MYPEAVITPVPRSCHHPCTHTVKVPCGMLSPISRPSSTFPAAAQPFVCFQAQEDQKLLELAGVGVNYSAALKDEPIE